MIDKTKLQTIQIRTRRISLTSKHILEMMLSKGILSNHEYTKGDNGVFVKIANYQEFFIDNHNGLQVEIVTETKAEETI